MRARVSCPGPRRTVAAVAVAIIFLVAGALPAAVAATPDLRSGVDTARIPGPARGALPLINDVIATRCPELPPLWIVAQVQAESGWDEGLTSARPGGPAGLYQLDQHNWVAAGGRAWESDPPGPGSDVTTAETHLRVAIPWACASLRAATAHLEATGKPAAPLDAMLVCHVAGCGRVTGSATGVPAAGEADCDARCSQVIARYLAAVHANLDRFAAPGPPPDPPPAAGRPPAAPAGPGRAGPAVTTDPEPAAPPVPWTGGVTGCRPPDPTSSGCITGATRHGLTATSAAFGAWSRGPVIRAAGCWNEHAWNPHSDHPRGRACDLFATRSGTFAAGAELEAGWRLARWYRSNAAALGVKYLIWQGRYWDPEVGDQNGWGRRYTGGGVYDARTATGGHYDHVHVSFRE